MPSIIESVFLKQIVSTISVINLNPLSWIKVQALVLE